MSGRDGEARGFAQKGARLVERIAQTCVAPVERDEVEEVAMLPRRGIGLMCNCT
jgi:hypothetical protein